MLVELGCSDPKVRHDDPEHRPIVVYTSIPDSYTVKNGLDVEDWRSHLTRAVMQRDGVTNYDGAGGESAISVLSHPNGSWSAVARGGPDWVWSDNAEFQRQLSEFHQCPQGRPDGYESRYWRKHGRRLLAPGVEVPRTLVEPDALLTNVGCTLVADMVGGGATSITGKGTAATGTTFTTNKTLVTNAWAGGRVFVADTTNNQLLWGNVIFNNNTGSASVVTVDQWYAVPETGAAGTTPAAGFEFILIASAGPAWYMGITTTNITPAATDTSLSGEATANGMGRQITTFTVTSAASGSSITWTNSAVFTYTGSSNLTFYALGLFTSDVKSDTTDTMFWETSFAGSFTVTTNGDTATVTDTITGS
jgi:hypothetical protein